MNYLFYDDETANSQGRICSLGYEVVDEDGEVLDSFYSLINPESEFQLVNTSIHGIDAACVLNKPTFIEVYNDKLKALIDECIFVSHNAKGADLFHIRKSLAAYGIEAPKFNFIDTMDLAKRLFPKGRRGLDCICEHYGIEIQHYHHALDDAIACKKIYFKMISELGKPDVESRPVGYVGTSHHRSRCTNAINGSDQTFYDVLNELESEELRGDISELNSIKNLKIVVSGFIDGYTREGIKEALKAKGAKPVGSISNRTAFLSIGPNAGQSKIADARNNNIPVVSNEELLELLERLQ